MKLAILFCVVAFACVAKAQNEVALTAEEQRGLVESAKQKLDEAKEKVDELIDQASDILKKKINEAKDAAEVLADKLKDGANEISDNVYKSLMKVLDTIEGEVAELARYASEEGVDVSECTVMTQTLRDAAMAVVANSSYCLVQKIETTKTLVSEILSTAEVALEGLLDIREEAKICMKDVTGIKNVVTAFGCVTVSGAKASWVIAKQVPAVTFGMAKITALFVTLQPSLAYCMSKTSILTFMEESRGVLGNIKECISEKVGF